MLERRDDTLALPSEEQRDPRQCSLDSSQRRLPIWTRTRRTPALNEVLTLLAIQARGVGLDLAAQEPSAMSNEIDIDPLSSPIQLNARPSVEQVYVEHTPDGAQR
jgi:hypothetical protein